MNHSEYTIVCPKCRKKLDVGRELRQARLRCKNCNTEFVGSTGAGGSAQQVMTAAPVERQAPPANDPMSALGQAAKAETIEAEPLTARERMMARRKSPVPAIMICLVGMVGLGIGVYMVADRTSSGPSPDADGVGDTKPIAMVSQPGEGSSFYGVPVSGGGTSVSGGGALVSGGVLQQDAEASLARILSCDRVDASNTSMVTFVGGYENTSKQVLKHVRIEVDILDESGQKHTLMSEPYTLVPGYRKGWWSAASSLPATSQVTVTATRTFYTPDPDASLVGWAMKLPALKSKGEGETLLKLNVRGTIGNPLGVPLTQLRVVIDFFRESRIYVGSAPGMIVGGKRVIGPKGSAEGIAEFTATFDVAEMQNTHEITVGKVRVVGRKAVR